MGTKKLTFKIEGMTCASCAEHVQKALSGVPGVQHAVVPNWESGRAEVVVSTGVTEEALIEAVENAGYRAELEAEEEQGGKPSRRRTRGGKQDVDLMIIGAGSAGFAAAIKAAELGYRPVLVESGTIGGTCVNVGCVPSKTLIRALGIYHSAATNPFRGISTSAGRLSWPEVIAHKDELVRDLRQSKYLDVLAAYPSIRYLQGEAHFRSPTEVEVNGDVYRPGKILLATGASPWVPPIPGLEDGGYLTSTTAMELRELPRSLVVLGGNAVGLELAQVFARAGAAVTVVEILDRIAPMEDEAISLALSDYLQKEGMSILTGAQTESVRRIGDRVLLQVVRQGNEHLELEADRLLVATGRRPNTAKLGLERAGVEVNRKGAVVVNEYLRTTNPNVYAAGDVTGREMFVYVAAYCGGLAAENALTGDSRTYEPGVVPRVTFTDPQIASVGLTEAQAQEAGRDVKVATLQLEHVPKALAARDTRGLIKLVADRKTDMLLGAHILAPEAGEIVEIAVLAIQFGATVQQLRETLFPYLTLAEGLRLAAQTFEKDVTKLSCCAG